MHWQDILTILIPLMAFLGWMYSRIDKKFDRVFAEFKDIHKDIQDLRKDIQSLESRISRIEGQLIGPPHYWEPKVIEKKDNHSNNF